MTRSLRSMTTASPTSDDLGRPSVAVLRQLLDELILLWEDAPDEARMPKTRDYGPDLVLTVLGLAAHAHRMGRAMAVMVDQGFAAETGPTVRAIFEHGLTAQWMVQYGGDSLHAVLNKEVRQRAAAADLIERLPDVRAMEGAEEILRGLRVDLGVPETSADGSAKHFDQLCRDLDGESIYLAYRVLCGYTHAGPTTAGIYRESYDPPGVQLEPRTFEHDTTWLFHTCTGLVWAARAADMLDRAHPRREPLRRAARTLGISPEIQLSWKATRRRARDQAERKRAKRAERTSQADPPTPTGAGPAEG